MGRSAPPLPAAADCWLVEYYNFWTLPISLLALELPFTGLMTACALHFLQAPSPADIPNMRHLLVW
jgi:hypothetical protein